MADSNILVLQADGTTKNIDARTEGTNSEARQVVVLGDPSSNSAVAEVRATDPDSNSEGVVVRDVNTSAIVGKLNSGIVVQGITNSIGVYFDKGEPAVRAYGLDGTTSRAFRMNSDGAIKVYDLVNGTVNISSGTITSITNPVVANTSSTTVIPRSVSGSTSAVSDSGLTLVSPDAGNSVKIFGYSFTTTAQVQTVVRLTNGAGTSPTEYMRVALQAQSSGISGANIAVTPPGFLFATGANTTLSLLLGNGSLIHYTVYYFKESA